MGQSRHIKRMIPVRVEPVGDVTVEDNPIPVQLTLRFANPPLDYHNDGWAIAWTQNAVLCFWLNHRGVGESGWLPPADIARRASGGTRS